MLAGMSCITMAVAGRLSPALMSLKDGRRAQVTDQVPLAPAAEVGVGADQAASCHHE